MNDRSADILLAAENYPEDKSNGYYWNKRQQPRLRKLRTFTDIMVTKNERDAIWPMADIVDSEPVAVKASPPPAQGKSVGAAARD